LNENEAASRIISALKNYNGQLVTTKELSHKAGFIIVSSREFKAGIRFLESKNAIKLHETGARTFVALTDSDEVLAEIEQLLAQEADIDLPLSPEKEIQDFLMIEVKTPCGNVACISKAAYDKEKHAANFWSSIRKRKKKNVNN
jgi:hypothetical protein